MLKPDSLREALTAAIRAADGELLLRREPDVLRIYIDRGRLVAHLGASRGYEWRYRLTGTLIGFTAPPDALALPLLEWIRVHQPDLLLNHDRAKEAVPFEIDVVDDKTVDVEFSLELTETVVATPREDGGFDLVHLPEPPVDPYLDGLDSAPGLEEIFAGGERVA
jgi:hypothetical protein